MHPKSIMSMAFEPGSSLVNKGFVGAYGGSESAVPKSWFNDPFALLDSMGLGYKASPSTLSYETLRAMAEKNVIVSAIIQTRINQVSSFTRPQRNKYSVGFKIFPRDRKRKIRDEEWEYITKLENFVLNMGVERNPDRDSFEVFTKKVIRDRLRYDQVNGEIVRRRNGKPHSIIAVPADTIRLSAPKTKKGTPLTMRELSTVPKYVQVVDGTIVNEYTRKEMIFRIANPRTEIQAYGYGLSELEMLINTITAHLWAEEWNRKVFSQGSTVKGIVNIKGNIAPNQLDAFRRQWLCVPGDARIYTCEGAQQIASVFAAQSEVLRTGTDYIVSGSSPIVVWDGDRWVDALVHKIGTRRMATLNLSTGDHVRAGTDHLYLAVGDNGQSEWRKLKNLKEGDWVFSSASPVESGAYTGFSATDSDPRSIPINIPKIKEDLWEVLGWLSGDGCLPSTGRSHSALLFYHPNKEGYIAEKHLSVLKSYGICAKYHDEPREEGCGRRIFISIHQKTFRLMLEKLGFTSASGWKGSAAKNIPASVFDAPLSCRRAFLRGLFSADGGLHTSKAQADKLCLSAVSDGVRNDAVRLLNTVGLSAYHRVAKNGKYVAKRLYVHDPELFVKSVGFIQDYKEDLKPRKNKRSADCVSPAYTKMVATLVANSEQYRTGLTRSQQLAVRLWMRRPISASRSYLSEVAAAVGVTIPDLNLRQTQVSGVTIGEPEMAYDIETLNSDTRRYVLDGYITHNTQVSGVTNAWRTPVMNSEDLQWIPLQPSNNEMGYEAWMNYLIKVASAIFLIDPAEINFDLRSSVGAQPMFMSSNEAQQKVSKDRGLQPLVRFLQTIINEDVLWEIDDRYELDFLGLDAKTESEAIELRMKELQSYKTLNDIRREADDLPPVPGGDLVLNPVYVGVLQAQQQVKMQKDAAAQQQAQAGGQVPAQGQSAQGQQMFPELFGNKGTPATGKDEVNIGKKIAEDAGVAAPKGDDDFHSVEEVEDPWESDLHASLQPELTKAVEAFEILE